MGYRHPNPRLAKIYRSYSVEEVSRLFRVHKNTVRNWLRQGLTAIDEQRPIVIRGVELRRFLTSRRTRAKQICGPGRMYCLPCRAPKVPAGKMAECIQTGESTGTLQGICPDCDRMIYRRVNPLKLGAVRGDLDVSVTQARPRIEGTPKPNVNCDSMHGDQR
jgi:Helix-turn-helix domain